MWDVQLDEGTKTSVGVFAKWWKGFFGEKLFRALAIIFSCQASEL